MSSTKAPAAAVKPAAKPASKPASSSTAAAPKKAATGTAAKAPVAKKAPAGKKDASKDDGKKKPAAAKVEEAEPGLTPEQIAERERKRAEEMEELRQKAWLAEVEFERKQEAKKRKIAEEEARQRKETARITKALLEAAFDGELDVLRKLFKEAEGVKMKNKEDTADPHNNTLLSEAAAGGDPETVSFLIKEGANPNLKGEFGRTPLWRACFLGKAEVILDLLRGGADPRIPNEGGELPEHVAASASMKETLAAWDVAETDRLTAAFQARAEERRSREVAEAAQKLQSVASELEDAKKGAEVAATALRKAQLELEKRIHEYDTCVAEQKPDSLTQVALSQVKDAEGTLAEAKLRAADANEKLQNAKLQHREEQLRQESEGIEAGGEELVGVSVEIRDLDEVLLRDVGGKIEASGKWPLVIDTSEQASVFLRYADSNYVSALSAQNMEATKLRKSLLGSIRYGKPMVLDFLGVDLFEEAGKLFDKIQPGLFDSLLSKSLLKDEAYLKLIRKEDGEEYDSSNFADERVKRFKFILLTSARFPNEALVERTFPLRVKVKGG